MIVPVPEDPLPPTLYKYRYFDSDGFHFRTVTHHELWFTSARAFNDPFDTALSYDFDGTPKSTMLRWANAAIKRTNPELPRTERRRLARERVRAIRRDPEEILSAEDRHRERLHSHFGIHCLSEERDNLLLWAHYSDSHRGFCVGFSTDAIQRMREAEFIARGRLIEFAKMRYESAAPRINFYETMLEPASRTDIDALILTKSDHWDYEREWRLILLSEEAIGPGIGISLPPEAVTEVVLGCRILPENRDRLLEAVAQYCPTADVHQAQRDRREFRLNLERA